MKSDFVQTGSRGLNVEKKEGKTNRPLVLDDSGPSRIFSCRERVNDKPKGPARENTFARTRLMKAVLMKRVALTGPG